MAANAAGNDAEWGTQPLNNEGSAAAGGWFRAAGPSSESHPAPEESEGSDSFVFFVGIVQVSPKQRVPAMNMSCDRQVFFLVCFVAFTTYDEDPATSANVNICAHLLPRVRPPPQKQQTARRDVFRHQRSACRDQASYSTHSRQDIHTLKLERACIVIPCAP